jgi:hypothetical protein
MSASSGGSVQQGLSSEGQKEAFRSFQTASNNTGQVDSSAISQIGSITSEFIAASKEAAQKAESAEERREIREDMKDALNAAREGIREVNQRSHESQRGFATIALTGLLAVAGVALGGAAWLLRNK